MGGTVPFHEALDARLRIISPTRDGVARFLDAHPFHLTPHVADVIAALQARGGTSVYLVSGGFTQMIHPVADLLGIPRANVFANTILFNAATGAYAGFDAAAPTSRDGGKAEVVRRLKAAHGYEHVVMVGDGATDLQARPPATVMLGYGGIVVREVVAKGADWFVRDFKAVADEIEAGLRVGVRPAGSASGGRKGGGGGGAARAGAAVAGAISGAGKPRAASPTNRAAGAKGAGGPTKKVDLE
jgi:phosphoserine phosphatase